MGVQFGVRIWGPDLARSKSGSGFGVPIWRAPDRGPNRGPKSEVQNEVRKRVKKAKNQLEKVYPKTAFSGKTGFSGNGRNPEFDDPVDFGFSEKPEIKRNAPVDLFWRVPPNDFVQKRGSRASIWGPDLGPGTPQGAFPPSGRVSSKKGGSMLLSLTPYYSLMRTGDAL